MAALSAVALACLPLFGVALMGLGCLLAVSAAIRAGDRRGAMIEAVAASVAFCLGAAALFPL